MNRLQEREELRIRERRVASPSVSTRDAILRATGAHMFLAIGAIHFLQIVPTTEQTPLVGVGFIMIIAASLIVAIGLIERGDRMVWMAGAAVAAAALGGYTFTRIFNTPIDHQDVGNWSCMLGMAALFVETTLMALCLYATRGARAVQAAVTRLPAVRPQRRLAPRDPNAA
jgi:hypothetical protein